MWVENQTVLFFCYGRMNNVPLGARSRFSRSWLILTEAVGFHFCLVGENSAKMKFSSLHKVKI